jgi:protein-arginine kinase
MAEDPSEKIAALLAEHPDNICLNTYDPEYYNSLSEEEKLDFLKCLNSGIANPDSGMGVYAMQPEDYDRFKPFFSKALAKYHNVPEDATHVNDWSLDGVEGLPEGGVLDIAALGLPELSMRVRVGRNLKAFPLPGAMDREKRREMENFMLQAFEKLIAMPEFGGKYVSITPGHDNEISAEEYEALVDAHIMFKDMSADSYLLAAGIASDWPHGRGVYVSEDKGFIIWVGEEDHLRIMCMEKGTILNQVFDRLKAALDVVNEIEGMEFAMSPDYGVVTSCPTNLGTGMRASLHIQLPNLTADGTDASAKAIAKPLGLSVRGLGGEHTPIGADGTVDISPSARFCIKESEIITALYKGIAQLKAAEDAAAPKPDPTEGLTFYTEREEDSLWEPDEGMRLLLERLNLLRTKPKIYAKTVLRPLRQYFHSRLFDQGDGAGHRRMTREGIAALEDAIRFLNNVQPCPPLRLSNPVTRVAMRHAKRHTYHHPSGKQAGELGVSECTTVGHAHGAIGGTSTYAARDVHDHTVQEVWKAGGVVPDGQHVSMAISAFTPPPNNGVVACSADEHIAHMLMDDGDGYRPCRRIFMTPTFRVVGFGVNTPPGTRPGLMGKTVVCVFADSCAMSRVPIPPPPVPPPPTNVDDLIGFARNTFIEQEKTITANVRAAQTMVFEMRKEKVANMRDQLHTMTHSRIHSNATICMRNSIDHREPLDLTKPLDEQ